MKTKTRKEDSKPIRKRSLKRAKQEREYRKLRKQYLEANPICEVEGCEAEATEIHHRKGRTGILLTQKEHFLGTCSPHHRYIESHPIESKELGYSLSRLNTV